MNKKHVFVSLIPPRATFPTDMTAGEKLLMLEHVRYTQEKFAASKVLLYWPVMAPAGAFGMAVFEVVDEAEVRGVLENGPTVRGRLNTFEIYPMRVGAAQGFGPEEKQ